MDRTTPAAAAEYVSTARRCASAATVWRARATPSSLTCAGVTIETSVKAAWTHPLGCHFASSTSVIVATDLRMAP